MQLLKLLCFPVLLGIGSAAHAASISSKVAEHGLSHFGRVTSISIDKYNSTITLRNEAGEETNGPWALAEDIEHIQEERKRQASSIAHLKGRSIFERDAMSDCGGKNCGGGGLCPNVGTECLCLYSRGPNVCPPPACIPNGS